MKNTLKKLYQKLAGTETSDTGKRIVAALPDGTRIEYHSFESAREEIFIAVFPEHTIIPISSSDPPNHYFIRLELDNSVLIRSEIHFPTLLSVQSTTPKTFSKIWEALQAELKECSAVGEAAQSSAPPPIT